MKNCGLTEGKYNSWSPKRGIIGSRKLMVKAYLSTAVTQKAFGLASSICDVGSSTVLMRVIFIFLKRVVSLRYSLYSVHKEIASTAPVFHLKSQQSVQTMLSYLCLLKGQWQNTSCVQCKGGVVSKAGVLQSISSHYPLLRHLLQTIAVTVTICQW